MRRLPPLASPLLALLLGACQPALPEQPPPLTDMEEPPALLVEPDDEAQRQRLPLGAFSGVRVRDARTTLEEQLDGEAAGVLVDEVIANSPGDAAGITVGDLLRTAQVGDAPAQDLTAPSAWLALERDTPPGSRLRVRIDRAGRDFATTLTLTARVRHDPRHAVARLREESKVGVVLRTATAVEAAPTGLGAGGGAVIVGLSRGSPWRRVGLRFGDVLAKADGRPVVSPQVVLDAIRNSQGQHVDLVFARDGKLQQTRAPLGTREQEVKQVGVPLLLTHTKERGTTTTSAVLGLIHYQSTEVAWRIRLLWLISFGAGDADRLIEAPR